MTTPEGEIEQYLLKRVRETGGYTRKLKWISRKGAPDRMVWWPHTAGAVHFVEVKRPGGKLSPAQEIEINKMRDSGLSVTVIETKERVDLFIGYCR